METAIVRSLEEGPDYEPDWRRRQVEQYLAEVTLSDSPGCAIRAILGTEKDPFVRQFLRHRFDGRSANKAAFDYAVGCQTRNKQNGAASMIKAMIVADRTPEEIAAELGTKTQNIVTFAKIYFDARRFLNYDAWLRRVVFSNSSAEENNPEILRERRWMAAAFHRGWPGVEQVVFHRTPTKPEDLEALTTKLQATLASRALEFALQLETDGTAATEADLSQFLAARITQPRKPDATNNGRPTMLDWIRAVNGDLQERAEADSSHPLHEMFGELKTNAATGQSATQKRMRTRFAGS